MIDKKKPAGKPLMDFTDLEETLKKELTPKRFQHTIGVTYTAGAMAMRYGASIEQAMLAGYLHDCAKCLDDQESMRLLEENNIPISDAERKNPQLLHAKTGALLAEQKYKVTDPAVLHAIKVHTTGEPGMNLLDKIVFIADFIEPHRYVAPHLDVLRSMAFTNLDLCLLHILNDTLEYLVSQNGVIDTTTLETYDYYKSCVKFEPYDD